MVASTPDITTIATNLGIFSLAIAAAVGGLWRGLRNIKTEGLSPEKTTSRVAAATIIETTTLLMWSESNRMVVEAVDRLTEATYALRDEQKELRHQTERLRDKMP
jgi:hypothetical protein